MARKIASFLILLILMSPLPGMAAGKPVAADPAQPPAETVKTSSGLPIPRFVSLGADKVFVRTGPALRYPIKWIYQKSHMPVEIVQEYDTWRKIRDMDGDAGWIHQSLLSGERYAVVKGERPLPVRRDPEEQASPVAIFEPGVVARVKSCAAAWCRISNQGYEGWTQRKFLWGIYGSEDFH